MMTGQMSPEQQAYYMREIELREKWEFRNRLTAIEEEAVAELARIERDGGMAGFALHILTLARGKA